MAMLRCDLALLLLLLSPLGIWRSCGSESGFETSFREARPKQVQTRTLEPGPSVEAELAHDQEHSYVVGLTSGDYLGIVIEQMGIDVAVRVSAPDGRQLSEVNDIQAAVESERIFLVANTTGEYRIVVCTAERDLPVGRYKIGITDLRSATPHDRTLSRAENSYSEGQSLRRLSEAESQRKAVVKFKETLSLWAQLNDSAGEARTQIAIGEICSNLAENQEALDWYDRALSIYRTIGDRRGEAVALTDIGAIYYSQGDKQKAVEHYNQALPLHRAEANHRGLARTINNIGLVNWSTGDYSKAFEFYEPYAHLLDDPRLTLAWWSGVDTKILQQRPRQDFLLLFGSGFDVAAYRSGLRFDQ